MEEINEMFRARSYWDKRINDFELNEYFQYDVNTTAVDSYDIRVVNKVSTDLMSNLLHRTAPSEKAKHIVLLSALGTLLKKTSGYDDVVIFTPVYAEHLSHNTPNYGVPVRMKEELEMSFEQALISLNENLKEDYIFSNYFIDRALTNNSKASIISVLVKEIQSEKTFNNVLPDLQFSFGVNPILSLEVKYNICRYSTDFIERIVAIYFNLLFNLLQNSSVSTCDIELITEQEKHLVLREFNSTKSDYSKKQTLVCLFEGVASRFSARVAIVYNGKSLTYGELNERANKLARYLQDHEIKYGSIVGLMTERSLEMIVGILGILKSGGAYLPIDLNLPNERIRYLLEESQTKILLTHNTNSDNYVGAYSIIDIDSSQIDLHKGDNLNIEIKPENVAYCIFTSGSTGLPKGVLMEHRSVINLVNGLKEKVYDQLTGETFRVALLASYAFDASVQQIFPSLLLGYTLYIATEEERMDGVRIKEFYNKNCIEVSDGTPTHLRLLTSALDSGTILNSLKCWTLAGEVLPKKLVEEFFNKIITRELKMFNMYGPTETCVDSAYYEIDLTQFDRYASIPIGKPLPNERFYIIDNYDNLMPIGVTGELCIAGDGLARGYLNDNALTQKKFVSNVIEGEKVYRTGDLARWLPDGNIEYKGRVDNQIKLRGYRIELSEIEWQLEQHDQINVAIVKVKGDEEERCLIAYYISIERVSTYNLSNYMLSKLPNYMVPSYFVPLDRIPLTNSGKLNEEALPEFMIANNEKYIGPTNETEKILTTIWSEVLQIDKEFINVTKGFFELGGHSLKLIYLANRIKKEFNTEVSLGRIIELQNIANLSKEILRSAKLSYSQIQKAEKKEYYTLSSAQRRIYFLHELEKNSLAYNIPQVLILEGNLEIKKLNGAFNDLISRHESLRTSFHIIEGEPVQKIVEHADFEIEHFQCSETELDDVIKKFIRPFELNSDLLFRIGVVQITPHKHMLMVDMHHIISDGVSKGVLIKDFMSLYNNEELPELLLQYKDYAEWQRSVSKSEVFKEHIDFWLGEFSEKTELLELPIDYPRPIIKSTVGNNESFELSFEEIKQLKAIAETEDVSVFMIILTLYNVLLFKLTQTEDIVIGVPLAGRHHVDLEKMIGVFINTLPIRSYPKNELSFKELLLQIKTKTLACFENESYQYEELINNLKIERNTGRNPLFDVVLDYHNFEHPDFSLEGLTIKPYETGQLVSKFDISLLVVESNSRIVFNLEYSTELFKKETIARFISSFSKILTIATNDVSIRISDIDILDPLEKEFVLQDFNATTAVYSSGTTITALFEDQVFRTSDAIAIRSEGEVFTYGDLNELSSKIAGYLSEQAGVMPGDLVGVMLARESYLIPFLLGILKLGAAFVPIDPSYPSARINQLLEDSNVSVLVSRLQYLYLKSSVKAVSVLVDLDLVLDDILSRKHNLLGSKGDSCDLAYVIYTSGSTGIPKGVAVEHRSLVNYISWASAYYLNKSSGVFPLYTSISFDLTLTSIFLPLVTGNEIIIYNEEALQIEQVISDDKVDIIKLTPSHLRILKDLALPKEMIKVKKLIIGGELLDSQLAKDIYDKYGGSVELYNEYGPTEATVGCMIYKFDPEEAGASVAIGKPIDNMQIYVLDSLLKPVPIGSSGEIYISGDGLARGYWNNTVLTAEKFVPHPYRLGERMYRTGDLARFRTDGNVEYLDRLDNQVKLRGYRIELGEIELQLCTYAGVKECAVVLKTREEEDKYLVAYYTGEEVISSVDLRSYLSLKLPDYMIPLHYVWLINLPLTTNGKLDKKSLPDPEISITDDYVAPTTEVEEKLVTIWSEVLQMEKDMISIYDSFWRLGGNSLTAINITNRIKKVFKVEMKLVELFQKQTIKQQSEFIEIYYWLNNDDEPINGEVKHEIDI